MMRKPCGPCSKDYPCKLACFSALQLLIELFGLLLRFFTIHFEKNVQALSLFDAVEIAFNEAFHSDIA